MDDADKMAAQMRWGRPEVSHDGGATWQEAEQGPWASRLQAANVIADRAKDLGLCGMIHPKTANVCNNTLDHDDNHQVRELNAWGDPSGKVMAEWARLVLL